MSWPRTPQRILNHIQRYLDFRTFTNPNFRSDVGLGRVAVISLFLGSILTSHFIIMILIYWDRYHWIQVPFLRNPQQVQILLQWLWYTICFCIFHLAEFFVTAMYNPSSVSASSFLINHSTAYTAAYLLSFLECTIRFIFFPSLGIYSFLQWIGIVLVLSGQGIRTLSMITCGENFNHFIQVSHSPNHHTLVTHGIYRFLRHPSYVGFFYWCVGMQLMLGNVCCFILFTLAARMFFHQRIAFEENLLLKNYPLDYPRYMKTTFSGIP